MSRLLGWAVTPSAQRVCADHQGYFRAKLFFGTTEIKGSFSSSGTTLGFTLIQDSNPPSPPLCCALTASLWLSMGQFGCCLDPVVQHHTSIPNQEKVFLCWAELLQLGGAVEGVMHKAETPAASQGEQAPSFPSPNLYWGWGVGWGRTGGER